MSAEDRAEWVAVARADLAGAGYRVGTDLDLDPWVTPSDVDGGGTRVEFTDPGGARGYLTVSVGRLSGRPTFESSGETDVDAAGLARLLSAGRLGGGETHPSNESVEALLVLRARERARGLRARVTGSDEVARWFLLAGVNASPGLVASLREERFAWVHSVLTDLADGVPPEWALRRPGPFA